MNKKYIKIEHHPELRKDPDSGAIVNVDNNAFDSYKISRSKKILEEKRLNKIENEIFSIKNMILEIYKEIKKE